MKYLISILVLGQLILSCSSGMDIRDWENEFSNVKDWKVDIVNGSVDTIGVKNWLPDPELKLKFTNAKDSTCLTPTLDFYPIELENYIEKKLGSYLILRSTLFPPAPNTYINDKYYVIGWELTNYGSKICCDCQELESEFKTKLNLETKQRPKKLDIFNLKEE